MRLSDKMHTCNFYLCTLMSGCLLLIVISNLQSPLLPISYTPGVRQGGGSAQSSIREKLEAFTWLAILPDCTL